MSQVKQQFVCPLDLLAALSLEMDRTGDYASSIIRRALRQHLADVLRSQACAEELARLQRIHGEGE